MSELALELIEKEKKERTGKLDLGRCGLTNFPEELFELAWLEELSLCNEIWNWEERQWKNNSNKGSSNNLSIDTMPQKFANFRNLKKLNLEGDYSESWHIRNCKAIGNLTSLQSLNLSGNKISDISFLEKFTGLQSLNLSRNKISDFSFLEKLTALQSLDLRGNEISDFSFLEKLTALQSLDLRSNQISNINFLEKLTGLQSLNLSGNKISDFSFLEKLIGLKSLNLSSNKISDTSFLEKLTGLQSLDLSFNQIGDISFLEKFTGLESLDLRNNKISDISFLEELIGLQTLDLHGNQMSDISPLLNLLKKGIDIFNREYKTGGINISENPVQSPPVSIIEEGREAVINWFEQIEKQGGYDKLYEAKLIIVGEPGAGKTTLMNKLTDPNYDLNSKEIEDPESTVGINIYNGWKFNKTDDESIEFKCNIWDFGGQEIQYATHQFFLTPSALYILVADDRKQQTNFPYWFETVHLLGKDETHQSPILVVLNENKHRSITNYDHHFYKKRYSQTAIEFNEVDLSKNDARYNAMLERIQKMLCNLYHVGDEVPKQWKPIRDELREAAKTKNHINEKEYCDICAKHNVVQKEDQFLISKYLHKLGSILHFQDDMDLRDFIILNPQWAVEAVYSVLENDQIKKNDGKFDTNMLAEIWDEFSSTEQTKLLNLIKRKAFEICYQIDENKYIAAQLLNEVQPEFDWFSEPALRFRYKYKFMPKGIITRFIVRKSQSIAKENGSSLVWNKGVIVEEEGCKIKVIEDMNNKDGLNIIDIEVTSNMNEQKFVLREIRKEIEAIHKKWFKNVDYDQMVPCICEDCFGSEESTFFDYNELIKYRDQGEREIKCTNNIIKPVNVMKLLEGIYLNEELVQDDIKMDKHSNKHEQRIDFKPVININAKAVSEAEAKAKAEATNTVSIEIRSILGETELLKEDIEDERKLLQKSMDNDEIDVTIKDVEKAEKAMQEIEASTKDNKEPSAKSKNRLKRFINDLSNEDSSIYKTLKVLRKGRDYGVSLAEMYNKVAENIGLPNVPPLALDVIKKL